MDTYISGVFTAGVWGLDCVRALRERPWWAKLLVKFVFGRYAYRELIGMIWSLEITGANTRFDYGIEGTDYNKEKTPVLWWKINHWEPIDK